MKKLNRKLIPAFAMLLLSAVLMSTASFAWFSQNGDVTASGIQVTATAPAALWISATNNLTSFNKTMTFPTVDTNKAQISPVTNKNTNATNGTENFNAWTFEILKDASYSKVDKNGQVSGAAVGADDLMPDTNNNVYVNNFWLMLEGGRDTTKVETKQVKVSATVTSAKGDAIVGALRVALVAKGGSATDTLQKSTGGKVIFEIDSTGITDQEVLLETIAAQDPVNVYVYVWFEGEDDNCKNSAAQNLDQFSISFAFAAA